MGFCLIYYFFIGTTIKRLARLVGQKALLIKSSGRGLWMKILFGIS